MRHGQTYLNKYNRIQGWIDSPLTEQGELEGYNSGLGFIDVKFDEIITSDLNRTIKTAKLALKENKHSANFSPRIMPEFREFFFGSWEGSEATPIWTKAFQHMEGQERTIDHILNSFHEIDPSKEAENYERFWARIQAGLNQIIEKNHSNDSNILIVTHALTIECIVKSLFPEYKKDGLCDNASLTNISFENGEYELQSYNDCSHFQVRIVK